MEDYSGRRVLVVGLGKSGLAACRLLVSRGASVVANDRRERQALEPERVAELEDSGVALATGSHARELSRGADLVVVSPGVPLELPLLVEARRSGVPIWSELELGFRQTRGSVVAVTGTKGKSTTATLVFEMLQRAGRRTVLAGNIGAPLTASVDPSPDCVFVLEVSSFQLSAIDTFRPDVAVLLDVTPDHLDWHRNFEEYVAAKERLFVNQREKDWAVAYGGNPLTVEMASKARSRKLYFDLDCLEELTPHLHRDGPWIVRHDDGRTTPLVSMEEFQLPGRHNRLNAMAASAAAALVGVSGDEMAEVLEHFQGLPHAIEKVADVGGVRFYDDSKATNIQAVLAALASFDADVFLILGGRFKGGDFRDLRGAVARKVKCVLAIGESRGLVKEALEDVVPVAICADLESAVSQAHRRAVKGDVVLLSPAGSSFDMFRDYRERGEKFREIVQRLETK